MNPAYEVVVDDGAPYTEYAEGDEALKSLLLTLKARAIDHVGDFAYYDVFIYLNDVDVTDEVFERLKIMEVD
jgi:hypothetical protein